VHTPGATERAPNAHDMVLRQHDATEGVCIPRTLHCNGNDTVHTLTLLMDTHWHGLRRWAMAVLSAQRSAISSVARGASFLKLVHVPLLHYPAL